MFLGGQSWGMLLTWLLLALWYWAGPLTSIRVAAIPCLCEMGRIISPPSSWNRNSSHPHVYPVLPWCVL